MLARKRALNLAYLSLGLPCRKRAHRPGRGKALRVAEGVVTPHPHRPACRCRHQQARLRSGEAVSVSSHAWLAGYKQQQDHCLQVLPLGEMPQALSW